MPSLESFPALCCAQSALQSDPSISGQSDITTEAAALEAAAADVVAGRVISHDALVRRLRSWGKPDELPSPE